MSQMLGNKLSMTLELDGVPRYFIKKVPRYRYSVPSTEDTGNGTKKIPRYFSTWYCSTLPMRTSVCALYRQELLLEAFTIVFNKIYLTSKVYLD